MAYCPCALGPLTPEIAVVPWCDCDRNGRQSAPQGAQTQETGPASGQSSPSGWPGTPSRDRSRAESRTFRRLAGSQTVLVDLPRGVAVPVHHGWDALPTATGPPRRVGKPLGAGGAVRSHSSPAGPNVRSAFTWATPLASRGPLVRSSRDHCSCWRGPVSFVSEHLGGFSTLQLGPVARSPYTSPYGLVVF